MAPPLPPATLPPAMAPPATAEYTHTLQAAHPGAIPQQTTSRMFRSGDGKTRVDTGNTSVITDPAAGQHIVLDHATKQAHVMPATPAAPPQPGQPPPPPGMPGFAPPGAPSAPPVNVKDLGKSVMNGHEVEGKQFTYPPPALPAAPATPSAPGTPGKPAAPAAPGMPAAPKLPGMPAGPALPGMPAAPKPPGGMAAPAQPAPPHPPTSSPTVAEVWTSTKMKIPMATKMTGPFAQSSSVCHSATPGEPHPSAFQIPAGYKQV